MFWNIFYDLCISKGTKPNPVAKELGISSATITKWKNGSMPQSRTAKKIADYFDVSVDYLLGNADTLNNKKAMIFQNNDFTDSEIRLIHAYRAQPELQKAVDKLLGIDDTNGIYVYTAAHSDDRQHDAIIRMDKDDWNKIKNAPQTDDTLL